MLMTRFIFVDSHVNPVLSALFASFFLISFSDLPLSFFINCKPCNVVGISAFPFCASLGIVTITYQLTVTITQFLFKEGFTSSLIGSFLNSSHSSIHVLQNKMDSHQFLFLLPMMSHFYIFCHWVFLTFQ